MSSIQIPPLPQFPIVDKNGHPTIDESLWRQQELQSRSAWTPYTPTTANISSITVSANAFVQFGKMVAVRINIKGTSNGSLFTVTLPFKAAGTGRQTLAAALVIGASNFAAGAFLGSDLLTLTVSKYDGTTPANLEIDDWRIQGVYEAA